MIILKLQSVLPNLRLGNIPQRYYPTSRHICEQKSVKDEALCYLQARNYSSPPGTPGSGAGKGGGAGGSVRESGGSLGQYGAAQEEGYFYDKQKEQLKKIKKKLKDKPDTSKQDK